MKLITYSLLLFGMLFFICSCEKQETEQFVDETIDSNVVSTDNATTRRPNQEGGNTSGGDCDHIACQDVGIDYELITPDDIIPSEAGHDFRDNFLSNYNIGNDYIDYYYTVSEATNLFEYITPGEFWNYFNLLQGLHECAEKLQFGIDTDIPISTELLDQAVFVINDISSEPFTPQEVIDIMGIVEADFTQYHGMTRLEILNSIN